MMARASIQDVASELSDKYGLSKHDAEIFISAFFDLINEGLRQDKIVKIKGLGTFKVVDVKERESVNVNTGERVIIEEHGKITFVPDAIMRDLVNKPFAQFETVVLNEGVDIDILNSVQASAYIDEDRPADKEITVEDEISDIYVDSEKNDISSVLSVVTACEDKSADEKERAETSLSNIITPDVEVENEKTIQDTDNEENSVDVSVVDEEKRQIEKEDNNMKDERTHAYFHLNLWLIIFVCVLVGGIALTTGYYWGHNADKTVYETVTSISTNQVKSSKQVASDKKTDTVNAKQNNIAIKPDPADELDAVSTKYADRETQGEAQSVYERRMLKSAEAQVRTGAYHIIGTSQTVTVKKGENLKRLSKFYLGDGMECYVQVHNGITEIKEGMKINIPKLKVKKK